MRIVKVTEVAVLPSVAWKIVKQELVTELAVLRGWYGSIREEISRECSQDVTPRLEIARHENYWITMDSVATILHWKDQAGHENQKHVSVIEHWPGHVRNYEELLHQVIAGWSRMRMREEFERELSLSTE